MTYCLAISVDAGIVFCSDSRTNAGADRISTYSKMHRFPVGRDRQFVLLSSGNLATSQAVIARISRDLRDNARTSLRTVTSVRDAAEYIGDLSLAQQGKHDDDRHDFEATFLLGGQVAGREHRALMIYAAGNHITSSTDTPFLQIGESKYGRPILDRIIRPDTSLETAALCALVSMDSTMRSNLTVGPPIEVLVYEKDTYKLDNYHRFDDDSEFLRELKKSWDLRLKEAFHKLPPLAWASSWDKLSDEKGRAN